MIGLYSMALLGVGFVGTPAAHAGEAAELSGWVSPRWGLLTRPQERPAEQLEFGMQMARFGLEITGEPIEKWSYRAYTVFGSDTASAVTSVGLVDTNNNGTADTVSTNTVDVVRSVVREASVNWQPIESVGFKAGRMRIPFTSQAQSPDTNLLFPDRSGPNSSFLEGTDLGGLLHAKAAENRAVLQLGAFNGSGLSSANTAERGVLYTGRVDLNPLGGFSFDESGPTTESFRIGVGAGIAYHPWTTFDSAGYKDVLFQDIRASASFRLAFEGIHAIAEGLYRIQTDSLSSRPTEALGAYGQLGWYLPFGIEPVGRLGWVEHDRTFFPRQTWWGEAGLNFYPFANEQSTDQLKLTLQYSGEIHVVEDEQAHGVLVQAQLTF
ncbi:MAG: porin [Myxococcota bacterium]|nr:porin [Myxococcota bacterium]